VISQLIFGASLLKAILGGVIFNAVWLAGSIFQARVCDRTGLRPLTLGGGILAAAAPIRVAGSHAIGNTTLEAVMLAAFMLGHTIGPGPQGMAYAALSFPTPIRGSAIGCAQGMLRVGSILGFLFFPVVLAAVGCSITFSLLATAPVLIVAVALLIRWEPIGADIEAEAHDLEGHASVPALPT
jgi:MFS transporter, putative metabolite transport protein